MVWAGTRVPDVALHSGLALLRSRGAAGLLWARVHAQLAEAEARGTVEHLVDRKAGSREHRHRTPLWGRQALAQLDARLR